MVEYFTSQYPSEIRISVEVDAESEAGFSEHVVRTVRKNYGHLKLGSVEFEDE